MFHEYFLMQESKEMPGCVSERDKVYSEIKKKSSMQETCFSGTLFEY